MKHTHAQIPQVVEWLAPDDAPIPPQLKHRIQSTELSCDAPEPCVGEALPPDDPAEPDDGTAPHPLAALGRWLIMVLLFLLLALAASMAALYFSVDEGELPARDVRFGEQALQASSYQWQVPLAGPLHRTFEGGTQQAQELGISTSGHPPLQLPKGMSAELLLADAQGNQLFQGSVAEYREFSFPQDGSYIGVLTLERGSDSPAEGYEATGQDVYQFSFQLQAQPQVTVSQGRHVGGSVIGVRVSGLLGETQPRLQSELGDAAFVRQGGDWVAYLPVSAYQMAGDYTIQITAGDYSQEQQVQISYRQTQELNTFTADGSALAPYLGDAPKKVQNLFQIADPEAYWLEDGFIRPVGGRTVRNYEVMEYIDRIVDPALMADPALAPLILEHNQTVPHRHSLNVTFATPPNTPVVCPANGRVVFTGTVDGGGRCIAVEHGCGLKSVFYLLASYAVNEGDYVPQGTLLGKTQGHTICEVWLNDVPLCPWEVWGNYGGLFF